MGSAGSEVDSEEDVKDVGTRVGFVDSFAVSATTRQGNESAFRRRIGRLLDCHLTLLP